MTEGIAYQAKYILFKSITELYKDSALKVFHLDDFPKTKTLLNNEFPRVTADENYAQQIREWIKMTKVGRIIEKELEENTLNTINIYQLYEKGRNTEQIAHQLKLPDRVVKNVIAKIKNNQN